MYRMFWVCSLVYLFYKYILIVFFVLGFEGDIRNLMNKIYIFVLFFRRRGVLDIIWIMIFIYMWL